MGSWWSRISRWKLRYYTKRHIHIPISALPWGYYGIQKGPKLEKKKNLPQSVIYSLSKTPLTAVPNSIICFLYILKVSSERFPNGKRACLLRNISLALWIEIVHKPTITIKPKRTWKTRNQRKICFNIHCCVNVISFTHFLELSEQEYSSHN
jgi:hypothetical protein